jgi:hypothetical protein
MIKEYNTPVIKKAWQDASSAIAEADNQHNIMLRQ